MTTPDAWLILLLVLALWLTLAHGPLAYHPALTTLRLPRGRRPFRPQTPAACPLCRHADSSDASGTVPASLLFSDTVKC